MISDDQGFHSVMHFLFQNYKIKSEFKSELREFFRNLFCLITKYSDRIDIGTTNYDLAVETFCNSKGSGYRLVDGFEFDTTYIWRPEVFQQNNVGEKCVYLYKIHGSLDWTGQNTSITKDDMPTYRESGGSSANTIIAPTLSPKDAYDKKPFSTLLNLYGEKLLDSHVCIVIGFSFRDSDVSNYFKTFVEKGKHLIIISPSCHRNYVTNLFKLKDEGNEAEMKDIANTHGHSSGRNVTL